MDPGKISTDICERNVMVEILGGSSVLIMSAPGEVVGVG